MYLFLTRIGLTELMNGNQRRKQKNEQANYYSIATVLSSFVMNIEMQVEMIIIYRINKLCGSHGK